MIAKQASIKQDNISPGWSLEAGDFINKLLMRKPEKRLGYRGAYELMRHPWLKYYPWKDLYNKKIQAPFIPRKKDNFDKRYCDETLKHWCESEYVEPPVDWSKVPVDTPILVRFSGDDKDWVKRHFARYDNGHVRAWINGNTSWTANGKSDTWTYAKLAEPNNT